VVLLYKELMLGVFLIEHIVGVFFCTAFFAGVSLFVAVKLFGREEVLFGGASSLGMSFRRSNFLPRPVPDPSESLFFVMVAMILLLYVGIPLQSNNLISGLALTELLFFGALPLGLAYYLKLDLRTTFSLRAPSVISIVSAILFVIGILLASGTLVYYQNQFFPMPQKALEALEKLMRATSEHPFPVVLLLVAVLPAICEELSFRGFVLSGLLKRTKPLTAMIATAAFFAAFHLSLYRFLPTFLIGLAASFLVWRSRSIFVGMLLHFLNNGSVAFLNNYPQYDVLGLEQLKPSASMFFGGLGLVAIGWFISYRGGAKE
jgi:sodium transport system permease protein